MTTFVRFGINAVSYMFSHGLSPYIFGFVSLGFVTFVVYFIKEGIINV